MTFFCFSKNKRILSEHFKTKKRQYLPHSWSDKGLMGTVLYKLRSLDTTTTGFKCRNSMKATKNANWIRNCILKISQLISAKEIFFCRRGGGRPRGLMRGRYLPRHSYPSARLWSPLLRKLQVFVLFRTGKLSRSADADSYLAYNLNNSHQ